MMTESIKRVPWCEPIRPLRGDALRSRGQPNSGMRDGLNAVPINTSHVSTEALFRIGATRAAGGLMCACRGSANAVSSVLKTETIKLRYMLLKTRVCSIYALLRARGGCLSEHKDPLL
jgi:hypothetical protein